MDGVVRCHVFLDRLKTFQEGRSFVRACRKAWKGTVNVHVGNRELVSIDLIGRWSQGERQFGGFLRGIVDPWVIRHPHVELHVYYSYTEQGEWRIRKGRWIWTKGPRP